MSSTYHILFSYILGLPVVRYGSYNYPENILSTTENLIWTDFCLRSICWEKLGMSNLTIWKYVHSFHSLLYS